MINIAIEKKPSLIGKPSISMGHLYHSYVSLPEGILVCNWVSPLIPPISLLLVNHPRADGNHFNIPFVIANPFTQILDHLS